MTIHEYVLYRLVYALEDGRSHRNVGDEMSIHDIYIQRSERERRSIVSWRKEESEGRRETDPCGPIQHHRIAYDGSRSLDQRSSRREQRGK